MDYKTVKLTGCGLTAATFDDESKLWDFVIRVPEPQLRLFAAALETADSLRAYHENANIDDEIELSDEDEPDCACCRRSPHEHVTARILFDETKPVPDPLTARLKERGLM